MICRPFVSGAETSLAMYGMISYHISANQTVFVIDADGILETSALLNFGNG